MKEETGSEDVEEEQKESTEEEKEAESNLSKYHVHSLVSDCYP